MKQLTAVLAALLLAVILAACAHTAEPVQPQAEPAPAVSEPQQQMPEQHPAAQPDEPAQPEQPDASAQPEQDDVPAESSEPQPYGGTFFDEPLTLRADIEEVVSYEITVPQVTLDNENAAQYINDGFVALADSFVAYAQETVYETAQEKQTIGYLAGAYSITMDGAQLVVEYTVTERYAGEDLESISTRVYRFDAATGERIITE